MRQKQSLERIILCVLVSMLKHMKERDQGGVEFCFKVMCWKYLETKKTGTKGR